MQTTSPTSNGQERRHLHVDAPTRSDRRALIERTCEIFQATLGLQRDSVRNQVEHVAALWESFLTRHPGDADAALGDLSRQILRTQKDWSARVWQHITGDFTELETPLEDVCLYLVLWGELGNLRFCPELGCFLFCAARAYCRDYLVRNPEVLRGAAAPSAKGDCDFLAEIVKPIYNVIVAETFTFGDPPKPKFGRAPAPAHACNYDDWNELFWDSPRLQGALKLKGPGSRKPKLFEKGMSPGMVWPRLVNVDWAASLQARKSHRELHSLLPLFVGSYRIFLVQSVAFAVLLLGLAMKPAWGTWVQRSLLGLIAPVWVTFYEVGFQLLTPAMATSSRIFSLAKLVLIYLTPFVTFCFVWYVERHILDLPVIDVSKLDLHIDRSWRLPAVAIHLTVSSLVFLLALMPQRENMYRWRFYPKLLQHRNFGTGAFWLLVVIAALALNSVVINLCGTALYGVWALHGANLAVQRAWDDEALLICQFALLALPTILCFIASIPFFTSIVIAFVGTARGVRRLGGWKLIWYRRGVGMTRMPRSVCSRVLQIPHERPNDLSVLKAFKWWNHLSDRELQGFMDVWNTMLTALRERDLLSDKEQKALRFESLRAVRSGRVPRLLDPMDVFRIKNSLPSNREARRRIVALARSAQMQPLPSGTIRDMPTLSVLVPHYSETILYQKKDLFAGTERTQLMHFLIKYYRTEFNNFAERMCSNQGVPFASAAERRSNGSGSSSSSSAWSEHNMEHFEGPLYKWASMRMQTLWRTVEGIVGAYAQAFLELAKQQEPDMPQEALAEMVSEKFQMVLAVQQYAKFADPANPSFDAHQLAAVEALLECFGSWLSIAYIDEVNGPGGKRYFSCMIDDSCAFRPELPSAHRSWRADREATGGMRAPKFRIELPGFPILGHGKSDNQNCALIFTRGEVVQMIDANQDAYFEASLFLPLALQDMVGPSVKQLGGRRPGIVGFREHIFSDVGLLGRLAADSEFTFGTVVQRTMDAPLNARLHYGHPDIMDKLQMMQQGGVSKGARGLNLSEDVFAGLDLVLRGGWMTYKEYFHVGKGRDMGFMSALSFYAKVSMGNGEQAITRQWMRLGLQLPLPRLLGVFYNHVGFYLNQVLMTSALQAFAFLAAFFRLCQPLDLAFADAAVGITASYFGWFYLLFVLAPMLPLIMETAIEEGLRAALGSVAHSFLSLSPVFAAFQSKLMGYYFETTVHYGGAQYIPTGRGLATTREPFVKLFRTFAASHMHEGLELTFFIAVSAAVYFGWAFYVCMGFAIHSWMLAPFLFNPRQFDDKRQAIRDCRDWMGWLWKSKGGEAESWLTWADRQQEVRRNSSKLWVLLPSPRLLAVVCVYALGRQLVPPANFEWSLEWARSLLPLMPPVAHMAICLLAACFEKVWCANVGPMPLHVFLAIMAVSITCFEFCLIEWYSSTIVFVIFYKYMVLRFLLEAADGVAAHRPGGCCFNVIHEACRLWAHSFRLSRDFFLGIVLTAFVAVFACMPFIKRIHALFLFRTRPHEEKEKSTDSDSEEDGEISSFGEAATSGEGMRSLFMEFAPHACRREV